MLLRSKETLQLNCDWLGAGFLWPQSLEKWDCAGEQMWTAGFPQGLLPHSGHTHMQRRLNPGFGPVAWGRSLSSSPQKPLSLAATPYSSTPSSFSHPSLLFQIIFYNSPSLQTPFSLSYVFSFLPQIFFISRINTSQLSSSHLSSTPLSLISTPGMSFRLSSTFLLSLCGGPESSGCSTRMSHRHILTFRQP